RWTNATGTITYRTSYDGTKALFDLDGSNALTMRYVRTQGESPAARINASAVAAWMLSDRLGSVRVVTDNTGTVQDRINFAGFDRVVDWGTEVAGHPMTVAAVRSVNPLYMGADVALALSGRPTFTETFLPGQVRGAGNFLKESHNLGGTVGGYGPLVNIASV